MSSSKEQIQKRISELHHESVPEMQPPVNMIKALPPFCSDDEQEILDYYPSTPYFNASIYCNKKHVKFGTWLRHPATIDLFRAFRDYYREAVREKPMFFVMNVMSGKREVHGYYLHISFYDALHSWCEYEKQQKPQSLPVSSSRPVF